MRIAQVCHRYYPLIGGVETHVNEISVRLVRKGYDLDVVTTSPGGDLYPEETVQGVRIKRFRSWAPGEAYYFSRAMKEYLTENSEKYDIIHAHNYHAFPALYAAQAKRNNKLIFTPRYHGGGHTLLRSLFHLPYRFLARKALERSDKIICLSQYEKNLLLSRFDVPEDRVSVIGNGVTKAEFANLRKRENRTGKILCVSRLEKYKGVGKLIEVMPRLDQRISLDIVGQGSYEAYLIGLMRRLNLQNRVRFHSNLARAALLQLYADADVSVLLSRHEAFGNAVAEALAAGTHCIVANTSALSEWIDDENCFGVSYPIVLDELARIINEVLTAHSHQPVTARLRDWDDVVQKLEAIYTTLLS